MADAKTLSKRRFRTSAESKTVTADRTTETVIVEGDIKANIETDADANVNLNIAESGVPLSALLS